MNEMQAVDVAELAQIEGGGRILYWEPLYGWYEGP